MKTKLLSILKQLKYAFKQLFYDIFLLRYLFMLIFIYFSFTITVFHMVCPVSLITGFPCPGCGITRSAIQILCGHFSSAWQINPCIYIWLSFAAVFFYLHYYKKNHTAANRLVLFTGSITIAVWIYGMINYFPNKPPYTFNEQNLLHFVFSFFCGKP